jgi:hypothetical protein
MVTVRTDSWLRNTGKLAILYFASGLAFVPSGIVCAVLRFQFGLKHPLVTALLFACGLTMALFVWHKLEAKLTTTHALTKPTSVVGELRMSWGYGQVTLPVDVIFESETSTLALEAKPFDFEMAEQAIRISSADWVRVSAIEEAHVSSVETFESFEPVARSTSSVVLLEAA